MLDPWIIEEIKRKEQRGRISEQPVIQIPIQGPEHERGGRDRDRGQEKDDEDKPDRGVTIIDYGIAAW